MCLSFICDFWLLNIILKSTELKCTQNIKLYHFVHTILSTTILSGHPPGWWGFASVSDRSRVERFLQETIQMGYLPPGFPDALSWSQRPRLDCWLRSPCGLITFFDHYSLQ